MATTTRLQIPYPTPDDDVDVPQDMQALAQRVDAVVAIPDSGDLKFSARKNEHGNWIKADGRALAVGVYPNLRAALIADGSPFGADAGNPRIPNMQERAPVGAGAGYVHGSMGGAATHTLSQAQMPAHGHTVSSFYTAAVNGSPGGSARGNQWTSDGTVVFRAGTILGPGTGEADVRGSGQAHNNMPPYTVGQWFVYAG